VDSFDEMLTVGLDHVAKHMIPTHWQSPAGEKISLKVESMPTWEHPMWIPSTRC